MAILHDGVTSSSHYKVVDIRASVNSCLDSVCQLICLKVSLIMFLRIILETKSIFEKSSNFLLLHFANFWHLKNIFSLKAYCLIMFLLLSQKPFLSPKVILRSFVKIARNSKLLFLNILESFKILG